MISREQLLHYSRCFLLYEINDITDLLENQNVSENERKSYEFLLKEYRYFLREIEDEMEIDGNLLI